MKLQRQIFRFIIAGGLGFGVDAGALYLAMWLGADFYLGRGLSFLAAATFTWLFNRMLTFRRSRKPGRIYVEWFRYMFAMLIGGSVNYGVSAWMYRDCPIAYQWPVLAVAMGSIAGMGLNFFTAKFVVFK